MSSTIPEEEENSITRELTRGTPADGGSLSKVEKGANEQELARKRSQYYENAFSAREPHNTPRDRVNQDSIVIIEIKINTQVTADEFQLVSDLSLRLAQVYQRPENSILVTVEQNACLLFGSSPAPAYLLTVSALAFLFAPVTNLRNTILIQSAMQEILRIPPSRGVVRYMPLAEENFATNGTTVLGEIEKLERSSQDDYPGVLKSISRSMSRRRIRSSSIQSSPISMRTAASSFPLIPEAETVSTPTPVIDDNVQASGDGDKTQVVKKSKSIRNFLARRLSNLGSMGDLQ
ncbi:hypothetical protein VTN00DRAFT_9498 [Thermoascus crustaceus]|uniref:uncharacterized protein n=1 Tax=Thermoascus crustaceus TaxID=5088 RepID=UPI0037421021